LPTGDGYRVDESGSLQSVLEAGLQFELTEKAG